jgi:membrane-associated phospholipid phosphatase
MKLRFLAAPATHGLVLVVCLSSFPAAAAGPIVVHTSDPDRAAGDILQVVLPAIGLGVAFYQDDTEGMKQWGYSVGSTLAATEALKRGFANTAWGTRPNGGSHSFPSGHTSAACSGAAFIGRRHDWNYGVAAMAAAAFVGYSRVDERLHHWRDVIAGCAVGVGFSMLFVDEKPAFNVTPTIGSHGLGLSLHAAF